MPCGPAPTGGIPGTCSPARPVPRSSRTTSDAAGYQLRTATGLDGVRFHNLRHTCVTLLLGLGVPPRIVRDIVGHADIDVTMTIYAHAPLDEKRAALRKLDDRLR